jgi:N-acetylmuramic acid 6-phosphate etherase
MEDESPTEAILEATSDLDRWSTDRILRAIHEEDQNAHRAISAVMPQIEQAVEILVVSLAGGGTWFNVGAGTSGRIGTIDAAELPPTFGISPRRVQAIMAGGERALWQAVEGAEDHPERAAWELRERGLSAGDVVLAISASGRTPFTLGSIEAAHEVGARTISLCCNPHAPLVEACEIAIVPEVGPEVIAGSTRMKGGLAQKMVLHLLSTTVMVRLGYVTGNLMTHLIPASQKLRERAVRIVAATARLDKADAARLLEECGGSVAAALEAASSARPPK